MTGQYQRVSVAAQYLKPVDLITFENVDWQVKFVATTEVPTGPDESILMTRIIAGFGEENLTLRLLPDTVLNIQRPDPEADLIEKLCKVYLTQGRGGSDWTHLAEWAKDEARISMRAVLKAIEDETKGKNS